MRVKHAVLVVLALLSGLACDSGPDEHEIGPPVVSDEVYQLAHGCYTIEGAGAGGLERTASGETFTFTAADPSSAARFFLQPSDLGTYLLYDEQEHYLVAEEGDEGELELGRTAELLSDILLLDDSFESPAEWEIFVPEGDEEHVLLRHRASGQYLTTEGLSEEPAEAAVLTFDAQDEGCAEFPELTIDADGAVETTHFDDGDLFGIVETHNHLLTNYAFGGGGIFHGSAFHRLGVEHALSSCEPFHGSEGRRDLVGFTYDFEGELAMEDLVPIMLLGQTSEFNHHTAGYPEFTDWPNSWDSSTHQTMYYRWIERAYLGGVRLMVQHATGNSVLCDLVTGLDNQQVRYSCNDMVSVERIIEESYNLERYIDAQSGGPGQGWFRIVTTPAEAREVIGEGKLAVVLGIEISNLFDCFVTPREGFPVCDAAFVREQLDHFHELGVRAIFPVHKYDNAFSAGDGHREIIELGNFINSGYYSNFVEDCPDIPVIFDRGSVSFGGLNQPRDEYQAPPPVDMSDFADDPLGTLLQASDELEGPPLEGDYCQNAGLTPLGETLIREMILRGMILEIDHLPRRSLVRTYELLEEYDYPAAATHGNNNNGRLYQLGGVSKTNIGRCSDPDRPGAMGDQLRSRVELIAEMGGYPAEGFGFDFNGFAGGPRPRFGEHSRCSAEQSNPVTYPFQSYAGDITFTEPQLGDRRVDFNTEGMIHIGLIPELIEDARRDGVTDEELEPLFRSAEAYLRMWERAEERAAALQ